VLARVAIWAAPAPAVFARLAQAHPGDQVTITLADGTLTPIWPEAILAPLEGSLRPTSSGLLSPTYRTSIERGSPASRWSGCAGF